MDALDRRIVAELQGGFPLVSRPFAAAGRLLGIGEAELIRRLERLLADGVLSRFGPLFDAERLGGIYVLAAMRVPAEDFERTADLVNAHPEVAHNYEREHDLNMWFVVAAETEMGARRVLARIAQETGLEVVALPKEEEFFIGLRLAP
jgi:siroheme decarboxylase